MLTWWLNFPSALAVRHLTSKISTGPGVAGGDCFVYRVVLAVGMRTLLASFAISSELVMQDHHA